MNFQCWTKPPKDDIDGQLFTCLPANMIIYNFTCVSSNRLGAFGQQGMELRKLPEIH